MVEMTPQQPPPPTLVIWRRGSPDPIQLQVSPEDARTFIALIKEGGGIDPNETYSLETQIDSKGRRMIMVFSNIDAVVANVPTGIVPARGSSLIS